MPNRYEREIEEILRNLEQTEPKPGLGQKFGERFRRRPGPRMRTQQPRPFSGTLSTSERFLFGGIVAALLAGGYAYLAGANILTLILAIVSLICLVMVATSQVLFQPRRPQSTRYGNITITPLRRSPFNTIKTQWNLLKLKMRYRRRSGPR
jgi:predicted lipid-binding transport protein (Tim44 family)